jgi:hypothetical protein
MENCPYLKKIGVEERVGEECLDKVENIYTTVTGVWLSRNLSRKVSRCLGDTGKGEF